MLMTSANSQPFRPMQGPFTSWLPGCAPQHDTHCIQVTLASCHHQVVSNYLMAPQRTGVSWFTLCVSASMAVCSACSVWATSALLAGKKPRKPSANPDAVCRCASLVASAPATDTGIGRCDR